MASQITMGSRRVARRADLKAGLRVDQMAFQTADYWADHLDARMAGHWAALTDDLRVGHLDVPMVGYWAVSRASLRVGHLDVPMEGCWADPRAGCLAEMMDALKVDSMVVKLANCSQRGSLRAETMASLK